MQEKEYMQLLIQSLEKKIKVLQEIADNNIKQKELLQKDEELEVEVWEIIVKDKARQIEELEFLDKGFETIYSRVEQELKTNRAAYTKEIQNLQKLIARVTDLSVSIQAQEKRNKELAQVQFSRMRRKVRQVKQSNKAAEVYRNNMKRLNAVEAQFLDRKN